MMDGKEGRAVYLDVYFVVNWMMNSWILSCACAAYGLRWPRLAIAGAAGAMGGCLWELLRLPEIFRPFAALLLSAGMLWLCIGVRPRGQWMQTLFRLYAYSFLMAGLIPVASRYIPLWFVSVALSYLALKGIVKMTERTGKKEIRLEIWVDGDKKELKALSDSGNLLKEPIQGRPVIVVRKECVWELAEKREASWPILYQTIQGEGMMFGFWPDQVKVGDKLLKEHEVMIGLSEKWDAKGWHALVPESLLK